MQQDFKQFLIPARVVKETAKIITIEVPKSDKHEFKLSEDKSKNRFHLIAFIRSAEGAMEMWKPWEHKK